MIKYEIGLAQRWRCRRDSDKVRIITAISTDPATNECVVHYKDGDGTPGHCIYRTLLEWGKPCR